MKHVSLSFFFPPLHSRDFSIPPVFSTAVGNHKASLSWQNVNATRPLRDFALCTETLNVTQDVIGNNSELRNPRTVFWWYCGGKAI